MGRPFGTLEEEQAKSDAAMAAKRAELEEVNEHLASLDRSIDHAHIVGPDPGELEFLQSEREELDAERVHLEMFFWLARGGDRDRRVMSGVDERLRLRWWATSSQVFIDQVRRPAQVARGRVAVRRAAGGHQFQWVGAGGARSLRQPEHQRLRMGTNRHMGTATVTVTHGERDAAYRGTQPAGRDGGRATRRGGAQVLDMKSVGSVVVAGSVRGVWSISTVSSSLKGDIDEVEQKVHQLQEQVTTEDDPAKRVELAQKRLDYEERLADFE